MLYAPNVLRSLLIDLYKLLTEFISLGSLGPFHMIPYGREVWLGPQIR